VHTELELSRSTITLSTKIHCIAFTYMVPALKAADGPPIAHTFSIAALISAGSTHGPRIMGT
jgi:hypothetical protein